MRRFLTHLSSQEGRALSQSLDQLGRSPLATLMTALVIGITLAMPAALFTALKNTEKLSNTLQQTIQLTLFLKPDTRETDAINFSHDLKKKKEIRSLKIISPHQALEELQQQAGFQGTLLEQIENPLPWTFQIQPASPDGLRSLAEQLQQFPLVDSVQMDKEWGDRLSSLLSLANRFTYLIALFLGAAVLFIINNVIRSVTQQNQKEIKILQLFGATPAFIRRPFLYTGMAYGLLGGIIGWLLVDLLLLSIKAPLQQSLLLYGSQMEIQGLGFAATGILLGSSMLLGLIGSWFAVTGMLQRRF